MQLNINHYPVHSVSWGESTHYIDGQLVVNRDELLAHLEKSGELKDVNIKDIALVSPGTKTRIINIFDIFPARARLGEGAVDYPGILGPVQSVGDGVTASLENFAVLSVSSEYDKYHKVLDMSGPGGTITPHAELFHIAVVIEPKNDSLPSSAYNGYLKRIGLRVGTYLAKAAAKSEPDSETNYSLEPQPKELPRVAYVCMIASHQKAVPGEPILYGDDVGGLMPTILHPNEFLDGAVISPYWNLGIDTLSFQNNSVILDLYSRHGKDVNFVGVVPCVSHITRERRELSVLMATNLVHSILKADLAVVSKVGGGIPESDLMMTVESLEKRGVLTSGIIWSYLGDGTVKDSLSTYSLAANALASAGMQDDVIDLPEQEIIIGGTLLGPFTDNPHDKAQPAHLPIRARYRDVSGAINQLGASRVAQVEI
ncbi:glycine/sarcosine/betaine reductase component B subunit [Bacillus sp. Marseille-P3661]|uniref:glycine/sarcosine/betaine reductase component B subunit n=1 Tax=Bacillus sp. Marseille-P3661 TaxID=1936234 RepID=UPI000C85829D|nr:glycine/sarcosine/betaine reductase component B subunit [Bacillus sp. Marseille-P3661]